MCLASSALSQAAGGWKLCRENEASENTDPQTLFTSKYDAQYCHTETCASVFQYTLLNICYTHHCDLCRHLHCVLHFVLPVCRVQISLFYKDIGYTGLGDYPIQYDLILTNYISNDSIPK